MLTHCRITRCLRFGALSESAFRELALVPRTSLTSQISWPWKRESIEHSATLVLLLRRLYVLSTYFFFLWVRNKDDRHADILQGANPNEYFILTFEPDLIQMYLPRPDVYGNRKITFQQHSDAPLPSREALEVHCALAKILHASGMSERIDKIIQGREELKCLANDGSSDAKTLLFAFWASDSLFCLLTVIWKPASIPVRFLFLSFFFFSFKLKPSCMNLICSSWCNLAKNPFPVNTIITNWHAISYFPLAGVSLLRLVPSCLVSCLVPSAWCIGMYSSTCRCHKYGNCG